MRKYITLRNKILYRVFATFFAFLFVLVVSAQTFRHKVGDKVEALYKGTWYTGEVTGFYSYMYTVKVEALGLTVYPEEKEVRNIGDNSANSSANASGSDLSKEEKEVRARQVATDAQSVRPVETNAEAPCDWSAWGIMNKAAFMSMAAENSGTFAISTRDVLCHVRSRKVDFQLTTEEIALVNRLRNSPELIQALKDNYKGTKAVDYGKASAIKTGRYSCGGGRSFQPDLFILSKNEYNTREKKGTYTFSSTTNKLTWNTGTLSGGTMTGEYFPNINTITVYNIRNQILFNCNWAEK
jgi:hypothetical protein